LIQYEQTQQFLLWTLPSLFYMSRKVGENGAFIGVPAPMGH
jgi:hypothetical protein